MANNFATKLRICWGLLLVSSLRLAAQVPLYPYLRHAPLGPKDSTITALVEDLHGELLLGNELGVYRWDARNNQRITITAEQLPGVQAFCAATDSQVYVGGRGQFGVLQAKKPGDYRYTSLSTTMPSKASFQITRIAVAGKDVLFYSTNQLFVYHPGGKTLAINCPEVTGFTGFFTLNDKAYVNTRARGLLEVTDGRLHPTTMGMRTAGLELRGWTKLNRWQVVLATVEVANGKPGLYTTNASVLQTYGPSLASLASYVPPFTLQDCRLLSGGILALATQTHGCLLLATQTERLVGILDSTTGLPSGHLTAMAISTGGNLWLAHPTELVYVSPSFPGWDLSAARGLTGKVLTMFQHGELLYVGTEAGIYYLPSADWSGGVGLSLANQLNSTLPLEDDIVSSLLGKRLQQTARYKGKNAKARTRPALAAQLTPLALVAARLNYHMVSGFKGKCFQLIPYKGQLIAATNTGVYELNGNTARALTHEYVQDILSSAKYPDRLFVLTGGGLSTLQQQGQHWQLNKAFPLTALRRYPINSLAEEQGFFYLGTDQGLYRVSFPLGLEQPPTTERITFPSREASSTVTVRSILGRPVFFTNGGCYGFSPQKRDNAALYTELQPYFSPQNHYYPFGEHELYIEKDKLLYHLSRPKKGNMLKDTLYTLTLFQGPIDYLLPGPGGTFWVSYGGHLLRLQPTQGHKLAPPQVTLKVTAGDSLLGINQPAKLSFSQRSLKAQFDAIYPVAPLGVRYQYRLMGAGVERWSAWSPEGIATFPALADGDYTFQVRARGYAGPAGPLATFVFTINPPWYRNKWAFALYGILAVVLVVGIVRGQRWALSRERLRLEEQVQLRTQEVQLTNERLQDTNAQMAELALERLRQNEQLEAQKRELEYKAEALNLSLEENQWQKAELQQRGAELERQNQELEEKNEQLIRSEKLADIGRLVASVAHEINSPLGAIKGAAQTMDSHLLESLLTLPRLLRELPPALAELFFRLLEDALANLPTLTTAEERKLRQEVEVQLSALGVVDAAKLATAIVRLGAVSQLHDYAPLYVRSNADELFAAAQRLVRFAHDLKNITRSVEKTQRIVVALKNYVYQRQQGEPPVAFDLAENIEMVLTLYNNHLKHGILVERIFKPVPRLLGYPEELGQVWTNLVFNAVQAMQGKGQLQLTLDVTTAGGVEVKLTDNGPGIPPAVLPHIFEQFYTTKLKGEGTGLGLYICYNVVQKHKGHITVVSQPGATTFTVHFPAQVLEAPLNTTHLALEQPASTPAEVIKTSVATSAKTT